MRNRLPQVSFVITALAWLGFAVWLGGRPRALLLAFGINETTAAMQTEIRAFYGGVELAIAALMVLLWFQGHRKPSLLVGGVPLIGSACGRALGLLIDGYSSTHLLLACVEMLGATFCLVGYSFLPSIGAGSDTSPNHD